MEDVDGSGTQFQLRPCNSGSLTDNLSLSGSLTRTAGTLRIEYKLQGSLQCINRPTVSPVARRCHELWRHTCFELFFAIQGAPAYWETNLSLNGCWNVYRFDGYRTGMREENAVGAPRCQVVAETDRLSLTCHLDCSGIIDDASELEIGVATILETIDGNISYWALKHHGPQPDFHYRPGFLVVLPGLPGSSTYGDCDVKNRPAL